MRLNLSESGDEWDNNNIRSGVQSVLRNVIRNIDGISCNNTLWNGDDSI